MFESRRNAMLGFALIFIVSSLMGMLAFASMDETLMTTAAQSTPEPLLPFAERLEEAGSLDALVDQAPDGWVPVGAGVDYRLFRLDDPNRVHVARMDRANQGVFIESSLAQGRLNGGVERTSSQFERYEGAINYWGDAWGKTNDVLVAINGSFFNASGVPDRGMVHSGWFAKRFTEYQNGSGFVWKMDRSAFIGQCVYHSPEKQVITYLDDGGVQQYQGINIARGTNDIIIYTPQFDRSTKTDGSGVEIVVELESPMLVMPLPKNIKGKVVAIRDLQGNTPIPFDHVVISATGAKRGNLLGNIVVGDEIGISSAIKHFSDDNCVDPAPGDWSKTYASVGGSFYFLDNGQIPTFSDNGANVRSPRTAIAFNDDYIYFIVVDGRYPEVSAGMSMAELGAFARDYLGAVHGLNQDGGGSSTMVIDGVVVNLPSDTTEVPCNAVYLPLVQSSEMSFFYVPFVQHDSPGAPTTAAVDESAAAPENCLRHDERWVANGMMMVAFEAQPFSTAFVPGQPVLADGNTGIYLGPGSNYALLSSVVDGTPGTVLAHANGLNGVYAKGVNWWKVDFNGAVGWVKEIRLNAVP